MKKTPKFQINYLILKKKSNHVFQVVKVFNIGKRTSKYRLLNLSTSSETAHLESQIERKATIKEAEANMGSGTTAAVALTHDRQYLGCELNPSYEELQNTRLKKFEEVL